LDGGEPLTTHRDKSTTMAEPILTKFLTGAAAGFDQPTICHSGKPKPNTCYAVSGAPGRAGWVFVQVPSSERRRDGWWCPDCARQLREEMTKRGFTVVSQDIRIGGAGSA